MNITIYIPHSQWYLNYTTMHCHDSKLMVGEIFGNFLKAYCTWHNWQKPSLYSFSKMAVPMPVIGNKAHHPLTFQFPQREFDRTAMVKRLMQQPMVWLLALAICIYTYTYYVLCTCMSTKAELMPSALWILHLWAWP